MSPIFFRVYSERLSYFAVHWNQGNRITIPYAAVGYMTTTPKGNILIQAGSIRVTVQLGPRYKRRRKELDVIADALTDGRSYTTSAPGVPSNELAGEQVKDSERVY